MSVYPRSRIRPEDATTIVRGARSSAGEHSLDMGGVTGSIPVVPTTQYPDIGDFRLRPKAGVGLSESACSASASIRFVEAPGVERAVCRAKLARDADLAVISDHVGTFLRRESPQHRIDTFAGTAARVADGLGRVDLDPRARGTVGREAARSTAWDRRAHGPRWFRRALEPRSMPRRDRARTTHNRRAHRRGRDRSAVGAPVNRGGTAPSVPRPARPPPYRSRSPPRRGGRVSESARTGGNIDGRPPRAPVLRARRSPGSVRFPCRGRS